MTYNGWTNYETWCVHLWLTNDEATDTDARGAARGGDQQLRGYVEDLIGLDTAHGLATDLIGSALDDVNWQEIVNGLTEDDDD